MRFFLLRLPTTASHDDEWQIGNYVLLPNATKLTFFLVPFVLKKILAGLLIRKNKKAKQRKWEGMGIFPVKLTFCRKVKTAKIHKILCVSSCGECEIAQKTTVSAKWVRRQKQKDRQHSGSRTGIGVG